MGYIPLRTEEIIKQDLFAFLEERIRRGVQADRQSCPYNETMLKDVKFIKINMLTNPFEKFERKRFMYYSNDLNLISMNHALFSQMNENDFKKVRNQIHEDIDNYYRDMGV